MSVRKEQRRDPQSGQAKEVYVIHIDYPCPDGRRLRKQKVAPIQTRRAAEQYEREWLQALLMDKPEQRKEEVPTFEEWFHGRFWEGYVVGKNNKPSERVAKLSIFQHHLRPKFGTLRLDEIARGNHIDDFRASLVKRINKGELRPKTVNNILAVLSTSLKYAVKKKIITSAPEVGTLKVERPEIRVLEYDEYARLLEAAKAEGPPWALAVLLAGEAGLRIGEIRALEWDKDIDLVAGRITVNRQMGKKAVGTPKGGKRRTVPMTERLQRALRGLDVVRTGYVVRNADGSPLRDGQTTHAIRRIFKRAGLPVLGWHCLRHSYGTHASLLGVNPWSLQAWMGHRSITTTMGYVHYAGEHHRPLPQAMKNAASGEDDPELRILKMMSARADVEPSRETTTGPRLVVTGEA